MSYRDLLGLDRVEQLHLGVQGHSPEANRERARRAREYVAEHTADVNRAYEGAAPMVEPYAPSAPFGVHVLARNGGDVRDAMGGRHDMELTADLAEAMDDPDDLEASSREFERIRDDVLYGLRRDGVELPTWTPEVVEDFPGDLVTMDPSPRHLADVRVALQNASEVAAVTSAEPGGDGDARAARESGLRSAQTVTPGPRNITGARRSTAPSQDQARAAVVAAHERHRTDRIEDRVTESETVKSRVERRDYPTMAQRAQQQDQRLR